MGRSRSTSIYAHSKEEFLEISSKQNKSELDDDEDYGLGYKSLKAPKLLSEDEDLDEDYSITLSTPEEKILPINIVNLNINDTQREQEYKSEGSSANNQPKSAEVEEQELFQKLEDINQLYRIPVNKRYVKHTIDKNCIESGLNVLCSYLTESIKHSEEEKLSPGHEDKKLVIYPSLKKPFRAMSNNAIHEFRLKEALEAIITKNESEDEEQKSERCINQEYPSSTDDQICQARNHKSSHNNFSLKNNQNYQPTSCSTINKEVLMQNVECEEEFLKVMVVGSTHTGKTKLINNFLDCRRNKYIPSSGLEIKKKIVKLISKTVRIEFFDTDANFHMKDPSRIYYRICDAFLYVMDCTKLETFNFIKNVHLKIFDNSCAKSFVLVCLNWDLKSAELEESINIFSNEYNINVLALKDVDHFNIKNESINHLFSSVMIKKMDNKTKNKFIRSGNGSFYSRKTNANSQNSGNSQNFGLSLMSSYTSNNFSDSTINYDLQDNIEYNIGAKGSYQIESYNAFNEDDNCSSGSLGSIFNSMSNTGQGNQQAFLSQHSQHVKRRWSFYDLSKLS
jgi:hypothetical protein